MRSVDLHLHSSASDGTLAPALVVRAAAEAGLAGLALTDHDTAAGVPEASREAARLGLRFLPGAELSANEPGTSVHLLAYGFDVEDAGMADLLATYRVDRERRAREIVELLAVAGVPLPAGAVGREAGIGVPTRAHVARALVAAGAVSGHGEAFRRYLGRGRPAFVEKAPNPPERVIARVHRAGGIVVLAHPGRAYTSDDLSRWIEAGLDGIEIMHPENRPEERAAFQELARERGLVRSGGSDWHGPRLGRAEIGQEAVPLAWMEELAARAARNRRPPPGIQEAKRASGA